PAGTREAAAVGEFPEGRRRVTGEGAIDAMLAGIVGGESERPFTVAVVEKAEIARGSQRGALGLEALVLAGGHDQTEASGRRLAELPESGLAMVPARVRVEAALDGGEQRETLREPVAG